MQFLAGQWLDTYVPSSPKAGGFTITSPPSKAECKPSSDASNSEYPYLELAIQRSPLNPPAAFLFRPIDEILGSTLRVRVGGSFVFPPPSVPASSISRVIFIAGGVGINPLISMLSHIAELKGRLSENTFDTEVHFFYSSRLPGGCSTADTTDDVIERTQHVLFLDRLATAWVEGHVKGKLRLFFTGNPPRPSGTVALQGMDFETHFRRMGLEDLRTAVGDKDQGLDSIAYVCGVPEMTDEFVRLLTSDKGLCMDKQRVFSEKWW
jgi:ferredoxin-NADP reductase